tara:strand:- start:958 stop:1248 length:291 start_codon:yes stop_codon:yes gene_type:complete
MNLSFDTELRIETLFTSWLRNSIILLSLSVALRAFNEEKLKVISNILFLLSFFIAIYNFTNLQKITSNKYKKKITILYAFNITLLLVILYVYFKLF